jgi:V8-like Glu-specific endopeptidase
VFESGDLGPVRALPPGALPLVFPPDDRVPVAVPTAWPYSTIAKVVMRFPNGRQFEGSAVMIGPRHAMTAGHVVFDTGQGGWATDLRVTPAQSSGSRPFGSALASDLYSTGPWTDFDDVEYDFGLIELSENLGNGGGWLPYTSASGGTLLDAEVEVAGYPADRAGGNRQYTATGTIHDLSPFEVFYRATLDTYGGQSGSPVLREGEDGTTIVGIHTFGTPETNGGVRITPDLLDLVREVLGSAESAPAQDVLDAELVYRRWNRVDLDDNQGALFRFTIDDQVLKSGGDVRKMKIKVKPKSARGIVTGPGGELFTVHPGRHVVVREPAEGNWTVRLFLESTDRPRRARVRVKPSSRP